MDTIGEDSQLASFLAQTSFFQLFGSLLAFIGWCLCISSTSSVQWRQWHVENRTELQSGIVWIGIWGVCYEYLPSDIEEEDPMTICKAFGAEHDFLPREIFIAQDLMSLCAVVETVALSFFFFAFWHITKNEAKRKLTVTFFPIGGFLNVMAGAGVLIPVTWNMLSVLRKEKINFPSTFDMPYRPKDQSIGVGIRLGFASAALQIVSGLLFLGYQWFIIHKKTHPAGFAKGFETSKRHDSESCPQCGSSLDVTSSGHYARFCKGRGHNKLQPKHEVTFQIPVENTSDQHVAHTGSKAFTVPKEPKWTGSDLKSHYTGSDLDQETNTTTRE